MTDLDPTLQQLADAYAIATEYWDWQGRHVAVAAETVVAVLQGLGVDATTPESAGAALTAHEHEPWTRVLPPCLALRFDGVKTLDAFNSIYEGAKGGSLDASQNGYHFVTGGYGYLICIGSNDNAPDDPIMDWEGTIKPIVEGKNWDTTDLFTDPSIGMAPLVPVAKKSLEVKEPAFKITPIFSIAEAIRLNQKETDVSLTPPMPIGKQSV